MAMTAMLNVVKTMAIITMKEMDNEHPMPYVPKRKQPPRPIGTDTIHKGIVLPWQYIEHHINNLKASRKYTNHTKFKRNNKSMRRRSRWRMCWLHC